MKDPTLESASALAESIRNRNVQSVDVVTAYLDNIKKLNNVIVLPHIGSATYDTRDKMAETAAKNVIAVLSGKKAINPVN